MARESIVSGSDAGRPRIPTEAPRPSASVTRTPGELLHSIDAKVSREKGLDTPEPWEKKPLAVKQAYEEVARQFMEAMSDRSEIRKIMAE